MPKVSVILTSYNRPKLVVQAIESVLNQTYEDFELILCDDNSSQETKLAFKPYLAHSKMVYLQTRVKEEDRWKTCRYATLINMALKIAKGEYITYLCHDDIYYPRRLEVMVKTLEQNPNYFIVYGKQKSVRLSGRLLGIPYGIRKTVGITWKAAGKVDLNSIMHRRVCSDMVGGWDDDPSHWDNADAVFFKKLNQYWPFHPIDEVLDEHRFHKDSIQAKIAYEKRLSFKLWQALRNFLKAKKISK